MPDTHFNTDINPSKTAPAIRAYLGGSFNPVHNGHIQMAMYVYDCLAPIAAAQQRILQVSLLPNARSPFKEHSTDPTHRLAMLALAIQDTPLQISELELWQTPPVYSIDSVRTLWQYYPNDSLIFIMGMDSARSLEKWKNGLQLTDYVNLWMFSRSDKADALQPKQMINKNGDAKNISAQDIAILCNELPIKLQAQVTNNPTDLTLIYPTFSKYDATLKNNETLKDSAKGRIYIDPRQVTAVSSTNIRQQVRKQLYEQPQTADFAANNHLNSLAKLLNPTVYQYIIVHQLYSTAQFR